MTDLDIFNKIEHLVKNEGVIYPDIINHLPELKIHIRYIIKKFTGKTACLYFTENCKVKCTNKNCNNYVKCTKRKGFQKYCSISCSTKTAYANNEYTENRRKIASECMLRLRNDPDFMDRQLKSMRTDKNRLKQSIGTKLAFSEGRLKRFINFKVTLVEGLKCESSYEIRYVNYLIEEKFVLPNNCDSVKTPTGLYYPDFEYQDHYIEIKSTWTLSKAAKEGQLEKINWVSENVKPVIIINLDNKDWKGLVNNTHNKDLVCH